MSSSSPPSECNLESAWSCQTNLLTEKGPRHVPWPFLRRCEQDASGIAFHAARAHQSVATGMHANYCRCDVYVGSVIDLDPDSGGTVTLPDTSEEDWDVIFAPSSSSHRDPNRAPTEVAPSTPLPPTEEAPSIPETPKFVPEEGADLLPEPVGGLPLVSRQRMALHKPLLFFLIQGPG